MFWIVENALCEAAFAAVLEAPQEVAVGDHAGAVGYQVAPRQKLVQVLIDELEAKL